MKRIVIRISTTASTKDKIASPSSGRIPTPKTTGKGRIYSVEIEKGKRTKFGMYGH